MPWSGNGMTEEVENRAFGQRAADSLPGAAGRPHIGQHLPPLPVSLNLPRHCRARPCNPCPDRASTGSLNWRMGNGMDAMVGPWHDGGSGGLGGLDSVLREVLRAQRGVRTLGSPPKELGLLLPPQPLPSLQGSTLQSMP